MPKMTAMNAAVRILEGEGVRHIFGIPGAGILPFYRALKDLGTIKHLLCRHEEGAIHMADGYARAIGTVGVCAATSGPGASNFVTGLYTAQVDSIPLLAITGQNVRAQLGREAFQAVDIAADREAGNEEVVLRPGACHGAVGVPGGVPDHAGRAPRTRPDRSAPGCPEGGDRVRSRNGSATPHLQGAARPEAGGQGRGHAAGRGKARPADGRRRDPGGCLRGVREDRRTPADSRRHLVHGQERDPVEPSPRRRACGDPVQHPVGKPDVPRVHPGVRRGRPVQRPPHGRHQRL